MMPVYAQCQSEAEKVSQKYGLPKGLLYTLLQVESSCKSNAYNPSGASGIGQILPSTFKGAGCKGDPFDPEDGIECAGKILSSEISRWGTVALGLAAYHAGDKNVSKTAPCVPGTREKASQGGNSTLNYVKSILSKAGLPFDAPESCLGGGSSTLPKSNPQGNNPSPNSNPSNSPIIAPQAINPEVQRYIILGIGFVLILLAVLRYR